MAKIPELTAGSTPDGTEEVHAYQGSNSRRFTFNEMLAILHAHAISDVAGLQAALDAKLDDSQAGATGLSILATGSQAAARAAIGAGTGTGDLVASNNLSDVANPGTARSNLGLAIGTNVQAYSSVLTTYAGITPSANVQSLLGAANYAAMKTLLGLVIGTDIPARSPSIQAVTSSATVTPTFADDQVNITAQAAGLTLANPTGTAVDGWGIAIRIKDNGTARSIAFGTQYRAIGVTLPTTTVISKTLYLGMVFNNADTKWDVVAVAQEA